MMNVRTNDEMPDTRCPWAKSELAIRYHDEEWGAPTHDDRALFELLILEGAQAGLSWDTILKKRAAYTQAFDEFDPERVARYTTRKVDSLLKNAGIVRNRLKVESAVRNAQAFLKVVEEYGSFDRYIWKFVDGEPIVNHWDQLEKTPAQTDESGAMSKALKKRGFNFVGPTICYAFMQATGMVNDHLITCPRRQACIDLAQRA